MADGRERCAPRLSPAGDAMIIGGGPRPAPSMDEKESWRRGKDDGWLSAAHPVSPPDACRTGRHSDDGVYQCLSVLALTAPMRERSGKVAQEGPLLSPMDLTAR